jgi:formyltetrahydrofolate-dependent phosphoribosylglycinamide formyltransferase
MPQPPPDSWLSNLDDVREYRAQLDALGQKMVFTNGCFDLLHVGHVRYLKQARELGDALIVALNSDASVRDLKGQTRPVNTQDDRAEILMALDCVNGVIVFDEPRVTKLIEAIEPHIYTKGGDYTVESLNPEEREALERVHADIQILPLVPGRSTTATLQRLALGEEKEKPTEGTAGKLRLGILGSGHGSNFQAVQQAIAEGRLNADISVVISDVEDSRILRKARESGLPALFVDPGPDSNKLPPAAQKEICDHLRRHQVQVVVLTGFMRLVKEPILSEFKDRIVNVHPSLLPKFKGRNAWVQALEEGEFETGTTVHLVDAELDGGRILAQETVPIMIGDSPELLYERIQQTEHQLLPKVLAEWQELGLPIH